MLKRLAPYLFLLAAAVLFYRHILFADYVLPWNFRGYHLPFAHLYADSLNRGELPLWDPYTYCGRPFQANSQTEVFYPPMAIAAWAGAKFGVEHLVYLLSLDVVLHVFLAGVFAYWLGLALGLALPAALLLGTTYMLGGFFAAHAQNLTAVSTAAWLPLIFYCLVRCRERFSWRYGLLLAAALALSVLAGFNPVLVAGWVAAALYCAFNRSRSQALALAGATLGAAGLAAVQLGPSLQLNPLTIARFTPDWLGQGGGVPWKALVSLVSPNHYGLFNIATYHEPYDLTFMYLYCGIGALVLALIALRKPNAFTALLLLFGVLMLGDYTPVSRGVYNLIPQAIRAGMQPEFASAVFVLAIAALAALGLNSIPRKFHWAFLGICTLDLIAVSSGRPMNAMPSASEAAIARHEYEGAAETVLRVRAMTRQFQPPARVDTLDNALGWAGAAPTMRIATANGNDLLAPARVIYARLAFSKGERWGSYYEPRDLGSPVLSMMNVRYVIARKPIADLPLAAEVPGFFVHENAAALPRFWLVPRTRQVQSEDEAATLLRSPDFKPAEVALVENGPVLAGSSGNVRVLRYGLKDLTVEVEAPSASFLATSETHYPGWQAWVDGAAQPILYTNLAFRGVQIPAGKHVVRMAFDPALLNWHGTLSLASWLGWALLWWKRGRWRIVK